MGEDTSELETHSNNSISFFNFLLITSKNQISYILILKCIPI